MASTRAAELGLAALTRPRALALVWVPLLAVALLHYLTPPHAHWVHDVARRLYYLPVVMAGVLGGLRGGLLVVLAVELLYAPHAFLAEVFHDPATSSEKALEMGFYAVLGLAAGAVAERAARERRALEELSEDLGAALRDLREREVQLLRASRLEALGQLTAGLAHEIRNPLHAMRGTGEILLDAVPPDAPEHEVGRKLIGEIDRLSALLTRFLSFAKGPEGGGGSADLGEVAEHVCTLIAAQARREGVTVEVVPAGGPAVVSASRAELVQVVLGICINAVQSLQERADGTVTMEVVRDGGELGLRVSNDGPPIPSDALEAIFDPFFSTRPGGTGLGLSTAWRIVDAHGGRIEVENVGGGVAFTVVLPAG